MISFGWTWPALVTPHGPQKSVTRRDWKPEHARRFTPGRIVGAWTKVPFQGGRRIADIEIVSVERQSTRNLPTAEFHAEGFDYLRRLPAEVLMAINAPAPYAIWNDWHDRPRELYVVRFEIVAVDLEVLAAAVEDLHAASGIRLPAPDLSSPWWKGSHRSKRRGA